MTAATAFFQEYQVQAIDARRGNFPCALVHEMAKANGQVRKRPTARTWAQVEKRTAQMGVTIKTERRTKFLSHPEISGYYASTIARTAWEALDAIALDLTKAMSNAEVFALAAEYKTSF